MQKRTKIIITKTVTFSPLKQRNVYFILMLGFSWQTEDFENTVGSIYSKAQDNNKV